MQVLELASSEVAFREQWEFAPHESLPLGAHSLHAEPANTSLALKAVLEKQSQTLQDMPLIKRHIIKRLRHLQYKYYF